MECMIKDANKEEVYNIHNVMYSIIDVDCADVLEQLKGERIRPRQLTILDDSKRQTTILGFTDRKLQYLCDEIMDRSVGKMASIRVGSREDISRRFIQVRLPFHLRMDSDFVLPMRFESPIQEF